VVRPHIEGLLRLRRRFILGVYSSATLRTVNRALGLIRSELLRMRREGLQGDLGGWLRVFFGVAFRVMVCSAVVPA